MKPYAWNGCGDLPGRYRMEIQVGRWPFRLHGERRRCAREEEAIGGEKMEGGDLDDAEMRQSPNFAPSLRRDEFRQKLAAYYGDILKADEDGCDDGVT